MFLEEPREEDEIVYLEGIAFAYNKHEEELLNQTFIDYKDSWYGEGFAVCSPASEPCSQIGGSNTTVRIICGSDS